MDTNKRTGRYLVASVLAVAVLCVGVFFGVIQYVRGASDAALTRVGEIYMQEISHQVRLHFRTVVNLRLSQIQGVIWRTPPETARQDAAAARDRLVRSGQAIGFSTLALYSTAGGLDTLYGEPLTIEDADAFLAAMNRADPRITIGSDAAGQEYLVLGVSVGYPEGVGYPLNIEGECTALVAALPLATLNETLELEQGGSLVFSHIMRRNGDLVLVNTDLDTDNYYDWLCTGCTFDTGTGAEAAEALRQAVETGQDYSTVMRVEGCAGTSTAPPCRIPTGPSSPSCPTARWTRSSPALGSGAPWSHWAAVRCCWPRWASPSSATGSCPAGRCGRCARPRPKPSGPTRPKASSCPT